jgi:hypothetical protein
LGVDTEIKAYISNYSGWKIGWLINRMNEYFAPRILRRSPLIYDVSYKHYCSGCSNCLNEAQLRQQYKDFLENKPKNNGNDKKSIYQKLFSLKTFKAKETTASRLKREQERANYERLIRKSQIKNSNCGQLIIKNNLLQTQIDAITNNVNRPNEPNGILTTINRDPILNRAQIVLEETKQLDELNIKIVKSTKNESSYVVNIDGEEYRFNKTENTESPDIKIQFIPEAINLFYFDSKKARETIRTDNYLPKVFTQIKRLNRERDQTTIPKNELPRIRPFENIYLKYWGFN